MHKHISDKIRNTDQVCRIQEPFIIDQNAIIYKTAESIRIYFNSITFRFTKFFKNVAFELSLVISLKSIRNIMWWCIFRLLISSQFCYNWMELSIHICKMIYHCKDIFKSISYTVWKKNCISLDFFLGYKIHYVLLLHLSCFRKNKTSFCWSSFLWGLPLVFLFPFESEFIKNFELILVCFILNF